MREILKNYPPSISPSEETLLSLFTTKRTNLGSAEKIWLSSRLSWRPGLKI